VLSELCTLLRVPYFDEMNVSEWEPVSFQEINTEKFVLQNLHTYKEIFHLNNNCYSCIFR